MAKRMKKMQIYNEICKYGRKEAFIANVILCQHSNPASKLRGLLHVLRCGHTVRLGTFDIDVLIISDQLYDWSELEQIR